jgi:predicted ATPase
MPEPTRRWREARSSPVANRNISSTNRSRSIGELVIDDRQSDAITELYERLDRLPLAIELAACDSRREDAN